MRMWLSPFTVRLKPSQHFLLTGYTPIQNKKVSKSQAPGNKSSLVAARGGEVAGEAVGHTAVVMGWTVGVNVQRSDRGWRYCVAYLGGAQEDLEVLTAHTEEGDCARSRTF